MALEMPPRGPQTLLPPRQLSFPVGPITTPHLLPLAAHPNNPAPPPPRRPDLPPPPAGWTRTQHATPAAHPRELREGHGALSRESRPFGETSMRAGESKDARNERLDAALELCVEARLGAKEWSLGEAAASAPLGVFQSVERWQRDVPVGGYTLVCTHPNGTQKEHWHPTLRRVLGKTPGSPALAFGTGAPLATSPEVLIDDIWMLDHHNHGVSMDLNAGLLGPAETWDDVGRDILNFILHVLPGAKAATPGWQLVWQPEGAAPAVKVLGFGGSYGGVGHCIASHSRPDVYHGIFLADSLVTPTAMGDDEFRVHSRTNQSKTRPALKRRDHWPSRAEARRTWLQLEFYQQWHPEIMDLTISHGLVRIDADGVTDSASDPNVDDGPVTLAMPTWAEAAVFAEPTAGGRVWDMLPNIKVPVGFVVANSRLPRQMSREMAWRPPLARNEHLPTTDHLCLQADPPAIADAAWRFLQTFAAGWGDQAEIRASYGELEDGKAKL